MPMRSLFWRSTNSITELESTLAIYEPIVWASGALVLLGVVMEVVADRRTFKSEERKHSLRKWGEYLLIIGLVGEVAFGISTSVLSGLIIAKLGKETAAAQERTIILQKALAGRELTAEQQKEVGAALSKFSGQVVYITSYPNDPEAARLIKPIRAALELAKITVEDRTGGIDDNWPSGGVVFGIRIEPGDSQRELATELFKALKGKLEVEELSPLDTGSSLTRIVVGVKQVALADDKALPPTTVVTGARRARYLKPDQLARISLKLRKFAGQNCDLFWNFKDTEPNEIARQLLNACCLPRSGGWQASIPTQQRMRNDITGIVVVANPTAKDAGSALISALKAEGIIATSPKPGTKLIELFGSTDGFDESTPLAILIGKNP